MMGPAGVSKLSTICLQMKAVAALVRIISSSRSSSARGGTMAAGKGVPTKAGDSGSNLGRIVERSRWGAGLWFAGAGIVKEGSGADAV